jgi:putative hydrolase of HD superfamily
MNMQRDIELLFEISAFRHVQRTWKRFLNPDVANCAEHTWRVVWTALTIAKHEGGVDQEKLLKMALIHDLAESRTGDVDYISRQYTKRDEEQAANDMFGGTIHQDEIEILKEYEKRESKEAKIVKDADNIDVEIELLELEYKGHSLGTILNKDRKEVVYPKLFTETAKKMFDEIHKTNPHNWHINGRNRINAGDWKKK